MKKLFLFSGALMMGIGAIAQTNARIPVFEVFTSSTCGPCKPGNAVFHGVVDTKPQNDFVSLKYQQNFPGTGDPYCTAETQARRSSYYAINSIPRMEIDGGWDKNAQSFTETLYTDARNAPAEYKLSGAFTLVNKTITAKVKYAPTTAAAAAAGAKLHVVIVETRTVQNVKTNGETEFLNVVKKMLPNQNGTTLAAKTVNVWDSTTLTYTFNGNFRLPTNGQTANQINLATEHSVENFANLRVVAWIQGADKKIYQGANLMKVNSLSTSDVVSNISPLNIFPNPANNAVNIKFSLNEKDDVTFNIVDLQGATVARKVVTGNVGANQVQISTQELPAGYYTVIVSDTKHSVSVEKLTVVH